MKKLVPALALTLVATAAMGARPAPPPPTTPTVTPLAWYDSTGKLVGDSYLNGVLARAGEHRFYVAMGSAYGSVDMNAPYGSQAMFGCVHNCMVYFTSTDCTGPGYLRREAGDMPGTTRVQAIIHPTLTTPIAYFGVASGLPVAVTPRSGFTDVPTRCWAPETPTAMMLVPVEGFIDLTSIWTPPFYLK